MRVQGKHPKTFRRPIRGARADDAPLTPCICPTPPGKMHFSDTIRDLFRGPIITTWISQLYEDSLFGKNFAFAVDTAWRCGNLFVPLEAGLHYFGVRSTYILGLQIGLNFVPATKTETRDGGRP